jgi:hypothetical protein
LSLLLVRDKKFDRHRFQDAQMIDTPPPDTDEKNPFHLSFIARCEARELNRL